MGIIDIPKTVLRVQYRMARTPLQFVEDRVVSRWDAEAPGRLAYERSLGVLDAVVGRLLGADDIEAGGTVLARRSAALGRAAQLEAEATAELTRAAEEMHAASGEAAAAQKAARERKLNAEQDARQTAAHAKADVANVVAARTSKVKERVDETANERIDAAQAQKQAAKKAIDTKQQAKLAAVDAQLEDAADKRAASQRKLAHADDIAALADEEKLKRRPARAAKRDSH
jgi:hypothetical protein